MSQHGYFHNFEGVFLNVEFLFVLVGSKHNVKCALEIETSSLRCAIYFRKYIRIDVLENVLVQRQVISQEHTVFFHLQPENL